MKEAFEVTSFIDDDAKPFLVSSEDRVLPNPSHSSSFRLVLAVFVTAKEEHHGLPRSYNKFKKRPGAPPPCLATPGRPCSNEFCWR